MRVVYIYVLLLGAWSAADGQTGGSFLTSDRVNRAPAVTLHCLGAGNVAVPCGTATQPVYITGSAQLATAANQANEIQYQQAMAAGVGTPQDLGYTSGVGSVIAVLKGLYTTLGAGITAAPASGSFTSRSQTLVASQSTVLFPANATRHYLAFQAPAGNAIWVNFLGGTALPNGIDCVQLAAGTLYESGPFVTRNAINVYAPIAVSIAAWEG